MILAIQACHEPMASQYPVGPLCNYVFGVEPFPTWTEDGQLVENLKDIKEHRIENKVAPSHFFGQPETEHISGIIFSNQLTVSKFSRMAFQKGYDRKNIRIFRSGICHNPDPRNSQPIKFSYELGTKDAIEETWTQGLSLLVNAAANEPVSPFYFGKIATHSFLDRELRTSIGDFYPFNSVTKVIVLGN